MKLYSVIAQGTAFEAPVAIATSFDKAVDLAIEIGKIVDGDGYHSLVVFEHDADEVMVTTAQGHSNGGCTAREVGWLRRNRNDKNGVWEVTK